MAAELILHHYNFSNNSEKTRLVLGRKGLSWRSSSLPWKEKLMSIVENKKLIQDAFTAWANGDGMAFFTVRNRFAQPGVTRRRV